MSKFAGKGCIVKDEKCLTHGKCGVIEKWDAQYKKYLIFFDMGWQGWYHKRQLEIGD